MVADLSGAYELVVTILGTITLVGGAVAVVLGFARWVWRRSHPSRPPSPAVTLGAPWYDVKLEKLRERRLQQREFVTRLEMGFRGINNDETTTIREVIAGGRRKDTSAEFTHPAFMIQALGAGQKGVIPSTSTPHDFFDGLMDDYDRLILVWARFKDASDREWEVVYDPVSSTHSYSLLKP